MLKLVHPGRRVSLILAIGCLLLVGAVNLLVNQVTLTNTFAASAAGTCTAPPATFNAARATPAQLKSYGLPPHPTSAKALAFWNTLVSHAKHRICKVAKGTGIQSLTQKSTIKPAASASNATNGESGYYVGIANVDEVTGTWRVPCHQDSNGSAVTDLIGIDNSLYMGTLEDALTGNNQLIATGSWGASLADPTSFPVHCGDGAAAQITYDVASQQLDGYVEDTTNDSYYSYTVASSQPGNSAKWIEYRYSTLLFNFGTVIWFGADASVRGSDLKSASALGSNQWYMQNAQGVILAQPSGFDNTGAGWTDYFKSAQ